jgi:CubicO group peptidase (beta-lactamase class C family)
MRIFLCLIFALVFLERGTSAQSFSPPSDSEIRQILSDRVVKYQQSVGIVVGLIGPQGRRIVSYGSLARGDSRPLNGDTVFEIGSVTKVFTSLLLAEMAQRGEVSLSDPVARYLPSDVRMPWRAGREITLEDLATHTSGLPRMPLNVDSKDPSNPFADYSVTRLYAFLSSYQLPHDVGFRFEYSNLGGALLGHVLARRAGTTYEALVENRIATPLRMSSTRVALTPEMKSRFAVGHAVGLEPTPNWDLGALSAAGAFRSTANDLLNFLSAAMGYTTSPLAPAMAAMLKVRRDSGRGEVGLAWFVDKVEGGEIVSHSGTTGGYASFIAYDPKARVGVVVLSNSGSGAGVADIGMHLLNPTIPLLDAKVLAPPKPRIEITVDPRLLDRYGGRYRFPSSQLASVTREGGHLLLQGEGEVAVAFYPESNEEFFAKLMDAQITFHVDSEGRVTELVFHRNGSDLLVKRVE